MAVIPPPPGSTDFFDALLWEFGPDDVRARYFDEGGQIRDDAPQRLKDEIAFLRDYYGPPPERADGEFARR